jgi:hypothetical protein
VGITVKELVQDMRRVMLPYTAINLKVNIYLSHLFLFSYYRFFFHACYILANVLLFMQESRKNTLKDFVHVCGPLGITHFLIFSATEIATYLRICKVHITVHVLNVE